jgi:hypothetical protein
MSVPGPVIVDLKRKKLVHRMERFRISRCNANKSTVCDRFKNISNRHAWIS